MKLGEFMRRARASRLDKKAKYEAEFERGRRDLKLSETTPLWSRPPAHHPFIGGSSDGVDGTTYRQR